MQSSGSTSIAESFTRSSTPAITAVQPRRRKWGIVVGNWLGLVPFLLFCILFEISPTVMVIEGSFFNSDTGAFTLNNYQRMVGQASNLHAFQTSVSLAVVVAIVNTIIGFFAAYGLYNVRLKWVRDIVTAFSGIAANFAGAPLAVAFISTFGATGFITKLLLQSQIDLYHTYHFSVYSFGGLVLAYTYFELPLMILITLPALAALRPEWQEAATSLGASTFTYWRRIAFPILLPSLIGALMLLFANAFAAYATAYALAQGQIDIVPILISFVVNGNVGMDTGLGNALAVGMIIILLTAFALYTAMLRRVSKWQGR